MLINEVCKYCGLTKKAVEYYVEQGLVRPSVSENGYRNFSEQDADRLNKAAVLRKLGLSVAEARYALDGAALAGVSARKELELKASKERHALLAKLAVDGDYAAAGTALAALEQKQSILERLLSAFPGNYGRYLGLHFARYLGEPVSTPEQRRSFEAVIAFLDGVSFNLPQDIAEYLDQATAGMDEAFVEQIQAGMDTAAAHPEKYIEDNREVLEVYLSYKQSEEYKSSPAYRLEELLKSLYRESGYYSVFIPAMVELSPSYRRRQEALAQADPVFREKLGLPTPQADT